MGTLNKFNKTTMHDYQVALCEAIKRQCKIAVWADMGTGKTVSTLTAIQEMLDEKDIKRVLIIAPLTVAKFTWPDEYNKWGHINFSMSIIIGSRQERLKQLKNNHQVNIINKENVVWLIEHCQTLKGWPYDMIVIDESSMVKSHSTKLFKALKKVSMITSRFVELTGSPLSTGYLDLWSQFYLLDSGKALGKSITAFRSRYFYQPRIWIYTMHSWAARQIQTQIAPLVYRLDAEDCKSKTSINYKNDFVELTPFTMKKYKGLEREFLLELETETVFVESSLTLSNKLRQCTSGFLYLTDTQTEVRKELCLHDEKLKRLKELVDDLQSSPVIIVYQFEYEKNLILKTFPQSKTIKEDNTLDNWNAGKIPQLVCHPLNTAHGLNLQFGGHNIIWYSLTWSLELYEQLNARLARAGQTKTVSVSHILARGTIDELMLKVLTLRLGSAKEILNFMRNKL